MRKSEILRGSLELVVLSLLSEKEMYGYQISQTLKDSKDEVLKIGEGTLYPLLYRLEKRGFVKGRWAKGTGKRRIRYYKATAKGIKELAERKEYWENLNKAVKKMIK